MSEKEERKTTHKQTNIFNKRCVVYYYMQLSIGIRLISCKFYNVMVNHFLIKAENIVKRAAFKGRKNNFNVSFL